MSINHLIFKENKVKYDLHVSHTNTEKLSLKLNNQDTIDFHSLGSVGVPGYKKTRRAPRPEIVGRFVAAGPHEHRDSVDSHYVGGKV